MPPRSPSAWPSACTAVVFLTIRPFPIPWPASSKEVRFNRGKTLRYWPPADLVLAQIERDEPGDLPMSCYGWERGTLQLPTNAVTRLKTTVREANNALHERIYQEARAFVR